MPATIPLKHITEGTRLRPANDKQVAALIASIRDVGVLNPITVYPRKVIVDHIAVDGYGIVAGLHRYTACLELGMVDIPAHVVTLGELERQIAECDENLCGPKLTAGEKAMFTRRRKEAYEALHPETRAGVAGATARHNSATDNLSTAKSYAEDQASKTGVDARTVRRDAERGEKIDEDVLEQITGTHLDSGSYMDSIKGLTKPEQRAKVTQDLDRQAREIEKVEKQSRHDRDARDGAGWIVDAVGWNNVPALLAILDTVPTKKLCAELRRAIQPK